MQPNRDIKYLAQIHISNESLSQNLNRNLTLRTVLFIKLFCCLLYFNDLILMIFILKENLMSYSVTNVYGLQISLMDMKCKSIQTI